MKHIEKPLTPMLNNKLTGLPPRRGFAPFGVCSAAVALAASLLAPRAHAVASLEFDDVTLFGGTLSYGGADGVDPLVGTDIVFDTVKGIDTPLNNGVSLKIVGGKLNFDTGANISEGAVYTFDGGGTFTLTGTVLKPDLSVLATGTLLSGSFTGTSIVLGLGGGSGLFSGVGQDSKNQDLLDYYGITSLAFEFANTEIGFSPLAVSLRMAASWPML